MMGVLAGAALSLTLTASHRVDAGPPTAAAGPADANQPEHPLHITADHLTVLTKENKTQWTGRVHVVRPPENGQPPVDIRCQVMKTTANSVADAGIGKEGGSKIDKVYCHGDVTVEQGDRAGTGDDAVFDNVAGIVTVTGDPKTGNRTKARDGESHYSAELLTFYVDTNRLEMCRNVVAIVPSGSSNATDGGAAPTKATDGGKR